MHNRMDVYFILSNGPQMTILRQVKQRTTCIVECLTIRTCCTFTFSQPLVETFLNFFSRWEQLVVSHCSRIHRRNENISFMKKELSATISKEAQRFRFPDSKEQVQKHSSMREMHIRLCGLGILQCVFLTRRRILHKLPGKGGGEGFIM